MHATPIRVLLALLFAVLGALVRPAPGAQDSGDAATAEPRGAGLELPLTEDPSWMLVPTAPALGAGGALLLVGANSPNGSERVGSLRLPVGEGRTIELPPGAIRELPQLPLAAALSAPRIERRGTPDGRVVIEIPEGASLRLPRDEEDALAMLRGGYPDAHVVSSFHVPARRSGDASRRSFETALRAIGLELTVSGDVEAGLEKTETVLLAASHAAGFDGQVEVLAEAAALRAGLLLRLGRMQEAEAASQRVLLTGPRPAAPQDGAVVPADAELLALARKAAERPALLQLRDELATVLAAKAAGEGVGLELASPFSERAGPGAPAERSDDAVAEYVERHFGAASAELERIVRELVATGQEQALADIGRAAAPALAAIVLEDLERERPPASRAAKLSAALGVESFDPAAFQATDPLILLWRADPEGCGTLISDHLDAGGLGWRMRLLQALEASGVLSPDPGQSNTHWIGRQCLHPVWLEVLARLLALPETTRRATPFVRPVAAHDALTPALVDAIAGVARDADADATDPLLAELDASYRLPSARTLWPQLLEHPRPEVRRLAVAKLGDFGPTPELLATRADPAPEVREVLAVALRPRRVQTPHAHRGGVMPGGSEALHPLGESEEATAALAGLLADPESAVRDAAFGAWFGAPDPVALELLPVVEEHATEAQKLATVEQARDRSRTPVDYAVLAAFADDPSDAVVAAVDGVLLGRNAAAEGAALDALATRLVDLHRPLGWKSQNGEQSARHAVSRLPYDHGVRGASVLLRACIVRGDRQWLEVLDSAHRFNAHNQQLDSLAALPADERALFVRWVLTSSRRDVRDQAKIAIPDFLAGWKPTAVETVRAATTDATLSGQARLIALVALLGGSLDADPDLARAVLLGLDWAGEPGLAEAGELIQLDADGAAGVALLLDLDGDDLPLGALTRLEADFDPSAPRARELRDRILARWRDSGVGISYTVGHALEALALDPPDEVDAELLLAAARDPELVDEAVATMGRLRDPRYLPELERALLGSGAVAGLRSNQTAPVQKAAIDALTAYLSPEAAAVLRRGLAVEGVIHGKPLHTWVEQGLDRIRRYHEEEAVWAGAGGPLERQDAARELVVMLTDEAPEVRAEAARGLATLGTVEALPKLIPLLRDDDASVRTAAREALDRLHARADAASDDASSDG